MLLFLIETSALSPVEMAALLCSTGISHTLGEMKTRRLVCHNCGFLGASPTCDSVDLVQILDMRGETQTHTNETRRGDRVKMET
ncbi:hypothetical protein CLIM01_02312 [Colletotrichum limetticola]|uniref:Secreted protein n=1 Tax=Colletotrichum limetticola TaxID=1209924 RepID=A0ABQ9Q9I6_9PEZI|nr:hypothetical protein CLIM01_02312 [Colletotrichum limetticola]